MEPIEDQKQALRDLVKFYLNRYPNNKASQEYYEGFLKDIDSCKTQQQLETLWQISDGWLDQ